MSVGFFDSGLGGSEVLKEAIDEGLKENVFFLADTKNTPYGTKDEEFVRQAIMDNVDYLVKKDCNPIVIACNTATSLCINEMREKYKDKIFIGTEPAVKVATDAKSGKKILVLATTITTKREKLHKLIDGLDVNNDDVILVPADKLVTFAEDVNCKNMTKEINEYIESIFSKYDLRQFSHLVLGCTHFPLFRDNYYEVICKLCPEAQIKVVDGAEGISKNLIRNINKLKGNNDYVPFEKEINVILTSTKDSFIQRLNEILENEDINVEYKLQ